MRAMTGDEPSSSDNDCEAGSLTVAGSAVNAEYVIAAAVSVTALPRAARTASLSAATVSRLCGPATAITSGLVPQ